MAGGDYNLGTAHGTIELNAASLGRASSALDHVANRMLLVGGAAVAGLGFAVKAAGDFEQQMSRFQAVSNSTQTEMDGIRKKALQLGQDSAYGATEVITAFAELGYAGVTTKEILGGVGDAVVYLAAAAEIPLKDASTALVNTMRQFSIPAKNAVGAVDDLARAANASTIDMADLITSLRYAGPIAAALNIPLNQVAQTLALLGNNGIRGSTAGTSLRGILIALTPTSDKAAAEFQKLGLITNDAGQEFTDAKGNVLSLEQATALAAATFKHKTSPSAETLRKDFKKLGLVAKEGNNIFFDSAGKLKSMAEVAQILHDHTANLTDEQKKLAFTLIFQRRAMASAIVLARGGAGAYYGLATSAQYNTTAQELMRKKLDNMKGAFKILKASIETFAITIGETLTPFLKKAADKLKDVTNWFIRLNPETKHWIVGIVGGIGGMLVFLGVLLKIGKGVIGMYKALKDLGAGLKIVAGILKTQILADPWILALVGIALAILYLYNASPRFRAFVKDFVKELGRLEVAFAEWIGNTVGSPEAKKFLHDFLHELGKFEVGFATWMENTFGSPKAKKFLHDFLHTLGQVEVGFSDFMLKTFGSNRAKQFLHGFLDELGHVEVGIVLWVRDAATSFWHFFTTLDHIFGVVGRFLLDLPGKIGKYGREISVALTMGFRDGLNWLWDFLGNIAGWIINFFVNAPTWLLNAGVDVITGLWNGFVSALGAFGTVLSYLAGWVLDKIGDAGTWLLQAGEDLVHGMWKGIKNAAHWLINKIKDWVGDIVDAVEGFFGIHSPSTVFAEIGGHLVAGLVKGIRDNAHLAQAAYDSLSPDAMGATLAFSVAGGKRSGAAGASPHSIAAATGGSSSFSTAAMERHLANINGQLGQQKDWGPPVVQVAAGVKSATAIGMEAVRQLKNVQRRAGKRNQKEHAA